jgi:hypothetical protein
MAHIQQPFNQSATYESSVQGLIELFNLQDS